MSNIEFQENDTSITFAVRVIPRASKSEVVGAHDGVLKIKLKSPPVDGAANEELLRLIARQLDVHRSAVEIISGQTSKRKRLRVEGISAAQLFGVLKGKS